MDLTSSLSSTTSSAHGVDRSVVRYKARVGLKIEKLIEKPVDYDQLLSRAESIGWWEVVIIKTHENLLHEFVIFFFRLVECRHFITREFHLS